MKCIPIQTHLFFRMTALFLVSVLVLLLIHIPQAHAAANDKIHYQGKLFDSGGSPVTDGSRTMRFRFYTASSGGSALWDETQTISTTGGLFSALLGSVTSLSGIDWNQALYLGVTVDSDSEMTPRHIVGAVPAAHTIVGTLGVAQGGTGTSTQFATGTVLFAGTNGTYSGDINKLYINSSTGNVGIGTSTPAAKLVVVGNGTDFALSLDNTSTGGGLRIVTSDSVGSNSILWKQGDNNLLNVFSDNLNNATLHLQSSSTIATQISASGLTYFNGGNVGIGTTTPVAKLDIYGTEGSADIFALSSSTNVRLLTLTAGGDIGLGTSTPTAQLHTTGSVRFETFGSGTLTTDADGNLSVSSDERLKSIEGSFTNGLAAIRGLEPIRYRWNTESGLETESIYAGFSAQNVMEYIEDAVGIDKKTGYFTLSDRPIIAASVNAIKELDITITELASSTAPTENEAGEKTFVGKFFDRMVGWFANAANGIGNLFANSFRAKDTLCINDTCVDETKLRELLGDTSTDSTSSGQASTSSDNDSSNTVDDTVVSTDDNTATSTDDSAATTTDDGTATTTEGDVATTTATSTDSVADEEPPVITLNGDTSVTIEYEGTYTEEGATATDNVDTDVEVVITGTVDTGTAGTYIITYTATDAAGNESVVSREVIVHAKIEVVSDPESGLND